MNVARSRPSAATSASKASIHSLVSSGSVSGCRTMEVTPPPTAIVDVLNPHWRRHSGARHSGVLEIGPVLSKKPLIRSPFLALVPVPTWEHHTIYF